MGKTYIVERPTQEEFKKAIVERRKKIRKIEPYTKAWEKMVNQVLLAWAREYISIHPCRECGGPVIKGFCCTRCGLTNP